MCNSHYGYCTCIWLSSVGYYHQISRLLSCAEPPSSWLIINVGHLIIAHSVDDMYLLEYWCILPLLDYECETTDNGPLSGVVKFEKTGKQQESHSFTGSCGRNSNTSQCAVIGE